MKRAQMNLNMRLNGEFKNELGYGLKMHSNIDLNGNLENKFEEKGARI